MKLTQNLVIGMNAIATLRTSSDVVTSEQLSSKLGVSIHFVQRVLWQLTKAKLINRKRGPGGGYWVNDAKVAAQSVAQAVGTEFVGTTGTESGSVADLNQTIVQAFLNTTV